MSLWFLLALMTAVAIFAVLWPLGRTAPTVQGGRKSAVYKDQLAEVDRDVATGLIRQAEGEAARVEISRRLLAAADAEAETQAAPSLGLRRTVALVALVGLPALAGGPHLRLGSPTFPMFRWPAAPMPAASAPLDQLVAQVQTHLEKNPPMAAAGMCWRRC